jgi:hypothetical protein
VKVKEMLEKMSAKIIHAAEPKSERDPFLLLKAFGPGWIEVDRNESHREFRCGKTLLVHI